MGIWSGISQTLFVLGAVAGILMYLETSKWLPTFLDPPLLTLIVRLSVLVILSILVWRTDRLIRLEREWNIFLERMRQEGHQRFDNLFAGMAEETNTIRQSNSRAIQGLQERLQKLEQAFRKQDGSQASEDKT